MKRSLAFVLTLVMVLGMATMNALPARAEESKVGAERIPLCREITVQPGLLDPNTGGEIVENETYGYVAGYELKKGHTLSISDTNYVFSVRKLADGNYSTMLKQATTDSFTATEDMTIGMLIRKPDKSALTAEELASIVIYDSQYGMIGVDGYAHRFTVEAETIDGGTATTRAAIFLPPTYTETGTSTRLIIMTNGGSAYLTESSWQGNTEANRNLVEFYLQNGYAVLVNDNTAGKVINSTSAMVPDLGCLQQLSGLMKSYEYVCDALNLEQKFSIHARSQGTFVGIRIMREYPELVKCALITGPNVSAAHRWTVIVNKDHTAKRFGFSDLTGSTFEADKFVGNDIYTDMIAEDYSLPPTFWMESSNDVCPNNNKSIYEVVERLRELGCTAEYQKFSDLTHSETCRLASKEATSAALAFLQSYEDGHTHSYTPTVTAPTCTEQGYTTYTCDCGDSYIDTYVDATGHSYENGICTACGHTNGPVITRQPECVSAERFEEVEVCAAAEGEGLVYQWYYRCAGETEFRTSSCTGDTFRTVMSGDLHGCEVYCVITDGAGNSVTSDVAVLTLAPEAAPEITPARIPGDVNGDGEVNNKDLTRLFRYLSGWDVELY